MTTSSEKHYVGIAFVVGLTTMWLVVTVLRMHAPTPLAKTVPVLRDTHPRGYALSPRTKEEPMPPSLYLQAPLAAHSAVVFDASRNATLFAQHADDAVPLASVTKLMTALVAYRVLGFGATVSITPTALATEGYDTLVLHEKWNVHDLIDYMLIVSSNKAARALCDAVDVEFKKGAHRVYPEATNCIDAMNQTAIELGMLQTTFLNESGLDTAAAVATNYGSAYDVARLIAYTITHVPALCEATEENTAHFVSKSGKAHQAATTNEALADIPGLICGKTGFTDAAGGNLAIAFDVEPDHPVVVVVLGSTKKERFTDMLTLVGSVRNGFGFSTQKTVRLPL